MKLIHTSDWHFGKSLAAGRDYEEDQRYFLDRLCELIRKEKVEAVLCSGDIYESARVKGEAVKLFSEAATRLCKDLKVKLIVIAGNHDSASRLASCSELLREVNMFVTGTIQRDPQPVLLDGGKVAVYSVPHFERNEVINLFPEKEEEIRTSVDGARLYFDSIRQTMDPNRRNIILSHSYVVGSEVSESEQTARLGNSTALPVEIFDGFDYVALGHIHKAQAIEDHIRYCGSPLPYAFGSEEKQEKGVFLIDTDTMEKTFVPLPLLHGRKTLKGTYDEIIAQREYRDYYLRIEVTDRYLGVSLQAELGEHFNHIIECRGKNVGEKGESNALSLRDIETMKDEDILCSFLREFHKYEPTEEEIQLFCDALDNDGEEEQK